MIAPTLKVAYNAQKLARYSLLLIIQTVFTDFDYVVAELVLVFVAKGFLVLYLQVLGAVILFQQTNGAEKVLSCNIAHL